MVHLLFWHCHIQVPQQISEAWRPFADPQLPAVFTGGWVGYCGYDTVRYGYLGGQQQFANADAHAGHAHNSL